jgi:energy-coupling factor transporter ATP-binding protein EcfA2
MKLQSVSLFGYRSAQHGAPITVDGLGQFNILIGPNNSGKSTVLRFLEVLASTVLKEPEIPIKLPWTDADTSWWWQGAIDRPIKATLVFSGPVPEHVLDPSVPGRFEHEGTWRISVDIRATPPEKPEFCVILVAPDVHADNGWQPVVRPSDAGSLPEYLNRQGQYVFSSSTDTFPYKTGSASIIKAWAQSTRFFDPVRAIDRGSGRRGLADGSNLLKSIREQQLDQKQTYVFAQFRKNLIDELNALIFEPSSGGAIDSFEIKGDSEEGLDLYVGRKGDAAPIALQYMGTGIAELTILMADILRNPTIRQYFIEEPECHLHPRLIRRLMARLRKLIGAQFFITTHSNVVLDSLSTEDRVYRFGVDPGKGTTVRRCSDIIEHGRTLDALGVSGGTLLQTNCVIWVEGPSDRIYLSAWMKYRSATRNRTYIEGSDFSFVFYGGKVLSHFAFADTGPEDFIRLVEVCRFSAVVMDLDIDPQDSSEGIRPPSCSLHERPRDRK